MSDAKRMAEDARRTGQEFQEHATRAGREAQEQSERFGEEFQRAAQSGFEAVNRSFRDTNERFQSMAVQLTDLSKNSLQDVFSAWEQLLGARSMGEVVDIQTRYAQKSLDAYMSAMSKVGEFYVDLALRGSKSVEQTRRSFG